VQITVVTVNQANRIERLAPVYLGINGDTLALNNDEGNPMLTFAMTGVDSAILTLHIVESNQVYQGA